MIKIRLNLRKAVKAIACLAEREDAVIAMRAETISKNTGELKIHTSRGNKMKTVVLMLISVLVCGGMFTSCSSANEKKAKKLIKEYMKKDLKYYASTYKPLSFSQLDSLFSTYKETEEGKELFRLASDDGLYAQKAKRWEDNAYMAWDNTEASKYRDSANFYKHKKEEAKILFEKKDQAYVGEFCGWIMTHKYKAEIFGTVVTNEYEFYLNKEITSVTTSPFGTRTKKQITSIENTIQNDGKQDVSSSAKDEDFQEFIQKFKSDYDFQLSRVKFSQIGVSKENWRFWDKNLIFSGYKTVDGEKYNGKFSIHSEKCEYSVGVPETEWFAELIFSKIDGQWYLTEFSDFGASDEWVEE